MFSRTQRRFYVTLLVLLVPMLGRLNAAQLPISVTAAAGQAGPNTTNAAVLYAYVANPDGTPKTDASVSVSKGRVPPEWTLLTLNVPQTFATPCNFGTNKQPNLRNLSGQLRIVTVTKRATAANDPAAGVYALEVAPIAPCGQGIFVKWIVGEYPFMVIYSNGTDRGTALGVLLVR